MLYEIVPVTGDETLIPSRDLADPDDRHVLAAAIVGQCDAIITSNFKDVPADKPCLMASMVCIQTICLYSQLSWAPSLVRSAFLKVRCRLKHPPIATERYLNLLTQQGLAATVFELQQFLGVL